VSITNKIIEEHHKCENCLYLLKKEQIIKCGETHMKYTCMLKKCVKEKVGKEDG